MNHERIPVITVVGSSNVDLVVKTSHYPSSGETVIGDKFFICPGGKGANQAVVVSRLGAKVNFISCIGDDFFGDIILNNLKKEKIETKTIIRKSKVSSGIALIIVDKKGENSIVVSPGANYRLNKKDIEKNKKYILSADVIVLQLEIPMSTVQYTIKIAKEKNIPVILNPAPARKIPDGLLKKIDILTPNQNELKRLTGKNLESIESVKKASYKLIDKGIKAIIVTLGEKGALLVTKDLFELVPSIKVKVIDTTGAGDAFTGGLSFALAKGIDLKKAVYFANIVAALSVRKIGAQSSPTISKVKKFLKNLKLTQEEKTNKIFS
ncbi:MAG: ribokinase [Candidatus Omnitrophica bacterium]|nr:ribokinase [Candidatus Omnitrophota bacterium]MCM8802432.1 ribokinase [Candidatus Omnitrophota bacterium]